jgi:hypothetical protein
VETAAAPALAGAAMSSTFVEPYRVRALMIGFVGEQ